MGIGLYNNGTKVVKIDFDFKYPVDRYKPKSFNFVPNAIQHARRINQEIPGRKVSTSAKPWQGPETLTLKRRLSGFGFSLRYFVVHPPEVQSSSPNNANEKGFNRDSYWEDRGLDGSVFTDGVASSTPLPPALDTFFVKTVDAGSSAELAGLKSGDRIVSVNGDLIGGKTYKEVVELIQYCTGELKLGVVPRNEDILQLVYEEYVYDPPSLTSAGANPQVQRNSASSNMPQPSVNKWSVPITTRKSASLDSCSNHSSNNGTLENFEKKYDPCVQFIAGMTVTVNDGKSSRSNSVSSSGSATPLQKSGKISPGSRNSNSAFDPCVAFIGGKPLVVVNGSPENRKSDEVITTPDLEEQGVQPQKLQKALRKEAQKKGYSVGTRLAPKPIAGVSKPGAVSNIAGLFASGNLEELSNSSISRKKSATLCLRDDFQIRSCKNKVQGNEETKKFNENPISQKRRTSSTSDERKPLLNGEKVKTSVDDKDNTNMTSPMTSPRRANNLTSLTTQATLVESRTAVNKNMSTLVNNTIILNGDRDGNIRIRQATNSTHKRTLLTSGRKKSASSSVENSEEEDDSHLESADECALENWKGRRKSYLNANAKLAEKKGKKNFDSNMEADDEDSDTNSSKIQNHKSTEESGVKPVIKEGPLNRKLERSLDRKKSSQRTWKPIYAVLKGHRLFCYKEGGDADDEIIQPIPVRSAIIEIANDYVKRKHIFRMVTSHGNEYLFQAEDAAKMVVWVNTLRDANPDKESLMKSTAIIKQEKLEEIENQKGTVKEKKDKGLIRRSHFGLRGSKKSRSVNAPIRQPKTEIVGRTFGRTLQECPPARQTKNVPLIVEHCCNIIESKGKDLVGLYRIPGNAAAVQMLQKELDERDPESVDWADEKWYEINNMGSLLKAFLRKLSEPVVPNDMYSKLIQANRIVDRSGRLHSIKNLVKSLPEYHYETLEFLVRHLKVLADNSEKNKMDPKNIAIVFGPTVIRSSVDMSMVQNVPDQCKIIETLVKQCDWMFAPLDDDSFQPIVNENESEVISAGVTKGLMKCYINQFNSMAVDQENDNSSKKGSKLSTLKSNLSMKLRNTGTKVVSPRTSKKPKIGMPVPDDNDTDEDTSGCYSQSPPTTKPEKKLRLDIGSLNAAKRRASDGVMTTKIGSFSRNTPVELQFSAGPKSPEMSPQLTRNGKDYILDDGNDSGVTSPLRIDSDDNMSVYSDSGAQSSRKESFDSLSGPSPRIGRRAPLPRQQSAGSSSNDEKSPPLQKSTFIVSPNCPSVKEEKETFFRREDGRNSGRSVNPRKQVGNGNDETSQGVVRRSEIVRRRAANFSPRASKRELYSIVPGDGNNYEEQILALLGSENKQDANERSQNSKNNDKNDEPTSPVSPSSSSGPFSPSPTDYNTDWWLSGHQNVPKRMANSPKDKTTALNIISSAISTKHRSRNNSDTTERALTNVIDTNLRSNPILSPTIVRRTALSSYNSELSKRIDNFNQKKDEHFKKMSSILSDINDKEQLLTRAGSSNHAPNTNQKLKTITSPRSPTGISLHESREDKFDRYLKQLTELFSESQGNEEERERINAILKNVQAAHEVVDEPRRRNSDQRSEVSASTKSNVLRHTKSGPVTKPKHVLEKHRMSPLRDDTYSNLNYSKLYPR